MNKLVEVILSAILYSSRNKIEISKNHLGGVAITSVYTEESGMCQYQTWETKEIDVYTDGEFNIIDGDYGIENISQPSCDELESQFEYDFKSDTFKKVLKENLDRNMSKKNLKYFLNIVIGIVESLEVGEKFAFTYSVLIDGVKSIKMPVHKLLSLLVARNATNLEVGKTSDGYFYTYSIYEYDEYYFDKIESKFVLYKDGYAKVVSMKSVKGTEINSVMISGFDALADAGEGLLDVNKENVNEYLNLQ